jgi:16S rRNA (cytosine967-C5)-methyltransferase
MINARTLAYQILLHLDRSSSHPDRLIRSMLDRHSRMEERERALMTELVYGVLRWQGRLDWHIDRLSSVKPAKVNPSVRLLLRLALYQILFLDRVPSHASVNETVKMAKGSQPSHVVGFVNAILREAIRRESRWTFPSMEEDPEGCLAVATSHPPWLVRRLLQQYGFDEARKICEANNSVAPMVLRVNTLAATASEVLKWLEEQEIAASPSPYLPEAVRISGLRRDVSHLEIFRKGWVQVQDEASQLVSLLASPRPGERVMDLCAGFGGKSTHLAILMENRGKITAVDKSAWKLEDLRENAARQGVDIIDTHACDALDLSPEGAGTYDRVILDAPCTGSGTIRRNPDIKWRCHPKDPFRSSRVQSSLLDHAALFVNPGGVLIYSTCSIFDEESTQVAAQFGESHPEWSREPAVDFIPESCRPFEDGPYLRTWPHRHGTDGFFVARWRNQGSTMSSAP